MLQIHAVYVVYVVVLCLMLGLSVQLLAHAGRLDLAVHLVAKDCRMSVLACKT